MPTLAQTKALLKKAENLNDEEKYSEVIALLTDELLAEHNSVELYTERARAHSGLQQWEEQLKYLDKALALDPAYYKIYNSRGNYFRNNKEYDKALAEYDRAIELKPDYTDAYSNRGITWHEKKEYEKALADCNRSIELNPSYAPAHINRGLTWSSKKEFDKALADFDRAIELKPDYAYAYNNRGIAWYEKKEYDKAMADYDHAIELKPGYIAAYTNRGIARYNKKEYDKAMADYDRAIEIKPDYANAYNCRGVAWSDKKEYDKALVDFNRAIELEPDDAYSYNNRGIVWSGKKEYDKALADYTRAITLEPDYANAYRNRGLTWMEKEEYEKAIADFEKAIRLDKSLSFLQTNINEARLKLGEKIAKTEATQNETAFFISDVLEKIPDTGTRKEIRDKAIAAISCMNNIKRHTAIDTPIPLVHYTKLFVADILVKDEKSRLRYCNVVNMNDPEEGKILNRMLADKHKTIGEYFKETKLFEDGDNRHNHVYIGSFLPAPDTEADKNKSHEDELIMWRTYGKDEQRNEAAGCSIVIHPDFFNWPPVDERSKMILAQATATGKTAGEVGEELYRVLYYDKNDQKVIRSDGFGCDEINKEIDSLTSALIELITYRNKDFEQRGHLDDIIYRILTELRHSFKAASYSFENEYRVIKYCEPESKKDGKPMVKTDLQSATLPRPFYIESAKTIRQHIRKIYIGPKVPNPERWMYLEVLARQEGLTQLKVQPSTQKFQ